MPTRLKEDIATIIKNDPATKSFFDAFLTNPGLHALWWHRVANFFYRHKMVLFGKVLSQNARFWTNIEIHPGATIGRRLFIDHGAGIVIGETAEIGDDVTIFHGVTVELGKTAGNAIQLLVTGRGSESTWTGGDWSRSAYWSRSCRFKRCASWSDGCRNSSQSCSLEWSYSRARGS
ncbi:Serine acetyltransferase [Listeria monocytogenes]|nr:Serine acetyltransferase [Listeria monocytogenes]